MQEQNEAIIDLARNVEQLGDNQRLATDTLIRKIGNDKPEEFIAQYNQATKDRDEAERLLAVQRSMTEEMGSKAKEFAEKLVAMDKELAKSKDDAKEAPKLRERVASLEDINDRKQSQLDELEPYIKKTKEGGVDVDLLLHDLEPHPFRRLRRLGHQRAAGRWTCSRVLLLQAALAGHRGARARGRRPADPPDRLRDSTVARPVEDSEWNIEYSILNNPF